MSHRVVSLQPQAPFSLAQTIAYLRRFPPCAGDFAFDERSDRRSVRGALTLGQRDVAFEVRERDASLELVLESAAPGDAVLDEAAEVTRAFVGADDSLTEFYEAAARDLSPFRQVVKKLHGLHHVRFLTLAEVTVHAVLTQRTPIHMASRQKRALKEAFGRGVGDRVAFPSFERLLALGAADFHRILRHEYKATTLPVVLQGVHELGESYLRAAPYAEAERALRRIPGVGPFSAAFILLRGLGRMDAVPLEMPSFTQAAQRIYGADFDASRVRALYGAQIGYWAFYVKNAA